MTEDLLPPIKMIPISTELLRAALLGTSKQIIAVDQSALNEIAEELSQRDDERSQLISMTILAFIFDETAEQEDMTRESKNAEKIQSDCCSTDNDSLCNCSCNSN